MSTFSLGMEFLTPQRERKEKENKEQAQSASSSFRNPATGTFAWVGAEEAEIIMLNDFRWKPSIIAWADMLLLLEGDS